MIERMTPARLAAALVLVATACSASPHDTTPEPPPDAAAVPGPPMVAEATLTDVPPQLHGAPYAARMFSAFHPADADAEHAPLLVFFNGGPGAATSLGLLAYGTGPMTLDPPDDSVVGGALRMRPNPRSFTRFASTLHIDERQAGFSYGLRPAAADGNGAATSCAFSTFDDALDYVRVLLAFFDAHEALRHVPLVIVGESYGGTRAMAMIDALMRYRDGELPADLVEALQAHFDRVFPGTPGLHPPEEIASRLRAVLIQPLVMGDLQRVAQSTIIQDDPYVGPASQTPVGVSGYDVRRRAEYVDQLSVRAARALAAPGWARRFLGVDLASIARLAPPERGHAFRPTTPVDAASELALEVALGKLEEGDAYLLDQASQCDAAFTDDPLAPNRFGAALHDVPLFITHARYDAVIYAPAILRTLQDQKWSVTRDDAPRPGVARPGWFSVTLPEAGTGSARKLAKKVQVRFPPYEDSGHEVTVTQGGDLADDVAAWLAALKPDAAPSAR
jgi:hypothetical protein